MTSEAAGHSRHPPNPLARAKGGNVQPCHSERSVRSEESKAERQRFLATLGMTWGVLRNDMGWKSVIPASTPRHSCAIPTSFLRRQESTGGGRRRTPLRLNIIPASWFNPQIFWKDVTSRIFWRECCVILWNMQSTMLNERQSQVSA